MGKKEIRTFTSLSSATVRQIVRRKLTGWTQKRLAEKFGTSQTTISNIFRGLVYSRITGITPKPRKEKGTAA